MPDPLNQLEIRTREPAGGDVAADLGGRLGPGVVGEIACSAIIDPDGFEAVFVEGDVCFAETKIVFVSWISEITGGKRKRRWVGRCWRIYTGCERAGGVHRLGRDSRGFDGGLSFCIGGFGSGFRLIMGPRLGWCGICTEWLVE